MDSIEVTPLPALAALQSSPMDVKIIRPLTQKDQIMLSSANGVYGLVLPIMEMFGIIVLNHQELLTFTDHLSTSTDGFPVTPRNF